MLRFKPNIQEDVKGKRTEFAGRTWIYQVIQYLALVQVGNELQFYDPMKISFAATFLSRTAAACWYTRVGLNTVPNSWNDFEAPLIQEFVPFDSVPRSPKKSCKLVQRMSFSSYRLEYREEVDRFCQGLKLNVILETVKSGV